MIFAATAATTVRRSQQAFSLIEVTIGVAIMAVLFISLYAGMTSGFAITQVSRENLRATQIMLERMEGLRLYNWEQLVYSNMIPTKFTNYYYPAGVNGVSTNKGIPYFGTMTVSNAPLNPSASYATNMRVITVSVTWQSGAVQRFRTMSTLTAKEGIQNYVYNAN